MKSDDARSAGAWLWKIPAITIAYFFGILLSAAVITATKMPWPEFPGPQDETANLVLSLIGALLMAVCLALLARGLRGAVVVRWLILAAFSYVAFGLNNQIEAAIFTTYGGTATMLVLFVLPCVLGAAAAAWLYRADEADPTLENAVTGQPIAHWWWRVLAAWLAFPVVYIFFGMLVAPIVVPLYQAGDFGLTLPGFSIMIPVALARSALYLSVTLPLVMMWSRSRRSLLWALAISFFSMMGLIGLVSTTFFPPVLRITHSIEILCGAIVYAWLLVSLLVPKAGQQKPAPVAVVAE
jgi:hypothetical protein